MTRHRPPVGKNGELLVRLPRRDTYKELKKKPQETTNKAVQKMLDVFEKDYHGREQHWRRSLVHQPGPLAEKLGLIRRRLQMIQDLRIYIARIEGLCNIVTHPETLR